MPTWSPPASPRLPATRLHARNLTQSQPRTPGGVLVAVPVPRNTSPRTRTRQRCAGTLEPALEHFFVTPRSFLVATNRRNCTSAPKHLSSHSPQEEPGAHAIAHGARSRAQPDHSAGRCAFKAFKAFKAHSGSLSSMQEHRSEFCGDIERHARLEAGGWTTDGKRFARYPSPNTRVHSQCLCALCV